MADPKHAEVMVAGVIEWNQWRRANPSIIPDLSRLDLSNKDLRGVDLTGTNLADANFSECRLEDARLVRAHFFQANLKGANLAFSVAVRADFTLANLSDSNLRKACLNESRFEYTNLQKAQCEGAFFSGAKFTWANLEEANLSGSNLTLATMLQTNLSGAIMSDSAVYGISVWDLELDKCEQNGLIVWKGGASDPKVLVDNLEVAQFVYLLLNNQNLRHVIDTITSKVVLILGRFSAERKAVLNAIRTDLRSRGYAPILFDFEKPSNRDITETVSTLAHMARFVIADITDARSIPQELMAIVPTLPSVPVQPLLLASQQEYGMFEHFRRYPWVLEPYLYEDQDGLLAAITDKIIGPAERKAKA